MLKDVRDIVICKCPFVPDHLTVCMYYTKVEQPKGSGYWKMNSSILCKKEFRERVVRIVNEVGHDYEHCNPLMKWEIFKSKIKDTSIEYCQKQASEAKQRKMYLQERLNHLTKVNIMNRTNEMDDIEKELDNMYNSEVKGAQIRSKVKWIEDGEKCTKYFLNLEKKHQVSNVIQTLKTDDDTVITEQGDLLDECCRFYENLYTSQYIPDNDIDSYLSDISTPSLSEHDKTVCDEEITEHELLNAVKKLKNGKSPGIDGIVPEFYKEYWDEIKHLFICMVKEVFVKGELPPSLKKAVVTLVHKKGSKDVLSNYRPICLNNYDYKIIAFVLSVRIQQVVTKVIHTDQSGYIKGRFIGQNAKLVHDVFDFCESNNVKGAIINLDFEKAYDRLEWNFLFKVLEKFNFGANFIKWIKILYSDPQIMIKNNGFLSKSLSISRGIRQGCPVSSLLFVIAIEIMAINIRCDNKIEGFEFNNEIHKISQYADDSTLLISNDVSIVFALQCINKFCIYSGMKLNVNKTEGIWLGPYRHNAEVFEGITFTRNPVRCLGLYIGHDKEGCYRENWMSKINKIKNCMHIWKTRKLTVYGRIMIVKTLAVSMLVYNFTMLHVPDEIYKMLNKCIYEFIWNKVDRIKRNTMINKLENGGLNMIDIESKANSLKAAWIPRLLVNKRLSSVLNMYLERENMSLEMLLNGNITKKCMFPKQFLPDFYSDCITSFNMCKTSKELNNMKVHDFCKQPIWCNRLFIHKDRSLLYKNWSKGGIRYVKDLYNEEGQFVNESYIIAKLAVKTNWMIEYLTVKKTIDRLSTNFDMNLCKYVNIIEEKSECTVVIDNHIYNVKDLSSKMLYEFLINRKCVRPYLEKYWSKLFKIDFIHSDWENIYMNSVHGIPCTKLKEFAYKMLHGLLVSREILYKWKKIDSPFCPFCKEKENVRHIFYDCKRVKVIWQRIGDVLAIDIKWKNLVLGYAQNITIHRVRNVIFRSVLYAIFKVWIQSIENENNFMNEKHIWYKIVSDLKFWNSTLHSSALYLKEYAFRPIWDNYCTNILNINL